MDKNNVGGEENITEDLRAGIAQIEEAPREPSSVPGPNRHIGNRTSHLSLRAHIAQSPVPLDLMENTLGYYPPKGIR